MTYLLKELGKAFLRALGLELIRRAAKAVADKIEDLLRRLRDWLTGAAPAAATA